MKNRASILVAVLALLAGSAHAQLGVSQIRGVTAGGILYSESTSGVIKVTAAQTSGRAVLWGGSGAPTAFAPTAGSVLFAGASGVLAEDNSNFFWNNTDDRLGIRTASPGFPLTVQATEKNMLLKRTTGDHGWILGSTDADGYFRMFQRASGSDTEVVVLNTINYLGLGEATPDVKLHVRNVDGGTFDGAVLALEDTDGSCTHNPESGSETVTCSSDESLKSNIADAGSQLDYVKSFRVREYNVRASGERQIGVIAQEVEQTHPEAVTFIQPQTTTRDGSVVQVDPQAKPVRAVEQPNPWRILRAIQELADKVAALTASKASTTTGTSPTK